MTAAGRTVEWPKATEVGFDAAPVLVPEPATLLLLGFAFVGLIGLLAWLSNSRWLHGKFREITVPKAAF